MALQKQKEDVSGELTEPFAQDSKTKMVEEEEEALVEVELEALGSESSFQTETPDLLGDGGHPTPEDEDDRPFFFEKNLEQLDTSHTVMCTFSISLAVPMASNIGKDAAAIPKMRRYYHIEYFLLPDDVEPRKLDLVLFGVVAKLFAECESKVVKPWFENDQIWVSWNHSINIHVTNEFLIKLRDHKVTLTIWDTKDKVSAKARFSKPRVPFSQVEDSDAIGKLSINVNNHSPYKMYCEKGGLAQTRKQGYYFYSVSPLTTGKRKSSTPKRGPALKERRQSKVSNAETLIAALTKKCGIASFQLDLMPLLSGERLVISRLQEKSSKILDAYMTFTTEEPLMSERQISELNPLIIKILSATCLPMTPVPIEVLQATCVPAYCRYQFHNLPPHQTQGQTHGTHIYFKDVNVILTGTISPGELREYFRGPPLEIEVHDRDRKMAEDIKTPSLFGEDQDDGKLSNVGFVSYKHTAYNPFTEKDNLWHPYGVAKVSLTDLLLGKKYLNISVPIHSCSVPYPGDQKDSKTEKIMGVLGSVAGPQSSPLPVGHYLESDSVLKVRVEIAVPLGLQAETADTEVANCPYGCIIYIFDYNNAPCLHDLLQEITEINAEALQLDSYPLQVIQMALATFKLKTTTKEISELDIITGFHILDGIIHLLVLEGLKDKAIKRLWEQTHRTENGRLDILYNSQLSFHQRLYTDLEAILYHIHLCKPLSAITRQPLLYVRDMVRQACFQALSRLDYLCHSKKLRDVVQRGLLPSAEMITVLSQEFGIPLTKEDLFIQRPPLPSVSSLALQKSRKPKFRAIRSSPADGKSVYNYSSQHLNSAERAKMQLRKELAKKPGRRFAYCHEYLSAMFDPVDLDTVRKESIAKSKNLWVSPSRFVYPGFKSYIESNLHPRMPDKTRLKELTEKWQENILFANILEPVLSRDRWSWDQRHIDFDLYKKPPVYLPASAPATHRAGKWSIFNG
uniref:Cilia and flagella associated protein 92 (putative) n=1 Tax=Chelonoidis abingdonii TaxID=106734 RepID=A0A8C0IYK6_CHEAB